MKSVYIINQLLLPLQSDQIPQQLSDLFKEEIQALEVVRGCPVGSKVFAKDVQKPSKPFRCFRPSCSICTSSGTHCMRSNWKLVASHTSRSCRVSPCRTGTVRSQILLCRYRTSSNNMKIALPRSRRQHYLEDLSAVNGKRNSGV